MFGIGSVVSGGVGDVYEVVGCRRGSLWVFFVVKPEWGYGVAEGGWG